MSTLLTKPERDLAHQGRARAIAEMEQMVPKGFHLVELSEDELRLILSMTNTHINLTASNEKRDTALSLEAKIKRLEKHGLQLG